MCVCVRVRACVCGCVRVCGIVTYISVGVLTNVRDRERGGRGEEGGSGAKGRRRQMDRQAGRQADR